jgi:hypothetical protein
VYNVLWITELAYKYALTSNLSELVENITDRERFQSFAFDLISSTNEMNSEEEADKTDTF